MTDKTIPFEKHTAISTVGKVTEECTVDTFLDKCFEMAQDLGKSHEEIQKKDADKMGILNQNCVALTGYGMHQQVGPFEVVKIIAKLKKDGFI